MKKLLLAVAILVFAFPSAARAEERIRAFSSDIKINREGSLDVIETIRVTAGGDQIRHGIFRDFPTRYSNGVGGRVKIDFTLLGTELDGNPVPVATEYISGGIRIKIGDPDKYVSPGQHRYSIRYRVTGELGRYRDYDELYWNVTGTGWRLPIDVAEVRIRLPEAAPFGQRSVYTGPQGSKAANAEVVEERAGEILFRTTVPLDREEGLTVAVAFPKGIVSPPDQWVSARNSVSDHGPPVMAITLLLLLFAYYGIAWLRAGRDPRAGTLVPLFSPPDSLSPSAIRFIMKMRVDDRTLAAALVQLAVTGKLRIETKPGGWFKRDETSLIRTGEALTGLSNGEVSMARALFRYGNELKLEKKNHKRFSAARAALTNQLSKAHEGVHFRYNLGLIIWGFFLIPLAGLLTSNAYSLLQGTSQDAMLSAASLLCVALAVLLYRRGKGTAFSVGASAVLIGLVGIGLGIYLLPSGFMLGSPYWILSSLLAVPVAISACWWMPAPTKEGRALMDRIASFKHYLSITESDRLDRLAGPTDTAELFERYLPYAIALEVENRWAERFEHVLARAVAETGNQGTHWYSGSGDPWQNPARFASAMGSTLASTIATSSSAPGSSSGSGGGGFSGGGGGGGGGGGW